MESIIRKSKKEEIEDDGDMSPIRKINTVEKNIMEHKKMEELQNKIIGQGIDIGLTKGSVTDIGKRKFIKKGILGIIMGIGIAIFSKIGRADGGFINFADKSEQIVAPAVKLVGSNTTEVTTTSTSSVDLLQISGLSIAADVPIEVMYITRKTSGAADNTRSGFKFNATALSDEVNSSTTDQAEASVETFLFGPRVTNYQTVIQHFHTATNPTGTGRIVTHGDPLPIATVTDLNTRGKVDNASITMGHDEVHIYSYSTS